MNKKINAVKDFHEAFGLGVRHEPIASLPEDKLQLRFNLMAEENEEFRYNKENLLNGSFLCLGF